MSNNDNKDILCCLNMSGAKTIVFTENEMLWKGNKQMFSAVLLTDSNPQLLKEKHISRKNKPY